MQITRWVAILPPPPQTVNSRTESSDIKRIDCKCYASHFADGENWVKAEVVCLRPPGANSCQSWGWNRWSPDAQFSLLTTTLLEIMHENLSFKLWLFLKKKRILMWLHNHIRTPFPVAISMNVHWCASLTCKGKKAASWKWQPVAHASPSQNECQKCSTIHCRHEKTQGKRSPQTTTNGEKSTHPE